MTPARRISVLAVDGDHQLGGADWAAGKRGVDRVLIVGGSSRMPMVANVLRSELGLAPELHDPDLAVARGAALYGEKKELERMVTADLVTRGRLRDGAPLEDAPAGGREDSHGRRDRGHPARLRRGQR